ncbi:MAG: hypothetical protein WDN00_19495 [Limisphaerales bacterium]
MPNIKLDQNNTKDQQAFNALRIVIIIAVGGIVCYAFCPGSCAKWYCNLSIGLLVAGASLSFGGFFGFLFGMPRSMARPPSANNQTPKQTGETSDKNDNQSTNKLDIEPSTNLEQISDWLTKILVGAGLTQLNKIPGKLGQLSDYIAKGMGGSDSDRSFVIAVIIFFGICGFLAVFLWTRLYMAQLYRAAMIEPWQLQALKEKDQKQQEEIEKAKEIVKKLAQAGAERAMEDPLLAERQAPGSDAQMSIAAQMVESQDESKRSATDLIILAFHEFQAEKYPAAATNAEMALRASPPKEMLWKIYNLLGLCYHCQQPLNWKPGEDMKWFDQAKKSYEAAITNKNSLSEELLSKANLCYVYLDAQKYKECEDLASEVIQNENVGGVQIISLCDLARIALAATRVMQADIAGGVKILNETKNISAFEYLFKANDLPRKAIQQFASLPSLKPDVETFLKRVVTN